MKKTLLLVFVVGMFNISFAKAQTAKGKVLIGVSSALGIAGSGSDMLTIGYSTHKVKSDANGFQEQDPSKTISLNLLPKVGYFVSDNFVLGIDATVGLSKTTNENYNSKSNRSMFTVGPFVRYYIPTETVLPFIELGGFVGGTKNEGENDFTDGFEYRYSIMGIGGGAGIAVPVGDKVTFDLMASYNSLSEKEKEDNEDNTRSVYGMLSLKLGISILLGSD